MMMSHPLSLENHRRDVLLTMRCLSTSLSRHGLGGMTGSPQAQQGTSFFFSGDRVDFRPKIRCLVYLFRRPPLRPLRKRRTILVSCLIPVSESLRIRLWTTSLPLRQSIGKIYRVPTLVSFFFILWRSTSKERMTILKLTEHFQFLHLSSRWMWFYLPETKFRGPNVTILYTCHFVY